MTTLIIFNLWDINIASVVLLDLICLPQVSTGLMYAEIGPHIPPAAVTPPTTDSSVWYTSLLHDESKSKQNALIPAGNG